MSGITSSNVANAIVKLVAADALPTLVGNLVIEVAEKVLRRELANKTEQENYIKQLANEVKLNLEDAQSTFSRQVCKKPD